MKLDDVDEERDVQKNKAGGDLKHVVAVVSGLVVCLMGVVVLLLTNPYAYEYLKSKETKSEKRVRFISGPLPGLEEGDAVTSPLPCLTKQCVETSGYILSKMDFSVNPCDDLYLYSCGGLHAKTKIPRKESFYVYTEIESRINLRLQKSLSSNATELFGKNSSAVAKMKSFYQMCIDDKDFEEKKMSSASSVIRDLGSWTLSNLGGVPFDKRKWSLQTTLTKLHQMGFSLFFRVVNEEVPNTQSNDMMKVPHFKPNDATPYMDWFYLAGITYRAFMIDYIIKKAYALGNITGDVQSKAEAILNFFDSLQSAYVQAFKRFIVPEIEVISIGKLQQKIGSLLDLKQYLSEMFDVEVGSNETYIYCTDPGYFESLGKAFQRTDIEVLANVLMINFLEEIRDYLPAYVRLPATVMREDFCTEQIKALFLPVVSAVLVQDFFTPETKSKVFVMAENIKKQIVVVFDGVPWFDEPLKAAVIRKAQDMKLVIAYPDWVVDPVTLDKIYQNISVNRGELLFSLISIRRETLRKIYHQNETEPWIGALERLYKHREFYVPTENKVNIAGSVLQLPSFSLNFPTPMQYGGMGTTVGHEIMHGFDNIRIMYDSNYKLEPNWNSAANESYLKVIRCLINHYTSVPFDTMRAHGLSSIPEDICDNQGFKLTYNAYKALGELNEPRLPGLNLTDDQMFFVAFGQRFCTIDLNDTPWTQSSHNHQRVRVRGVASNSEEFAKAFNCPKNSPMNPAKKCTIF